MSAKRNDIQGLRSLAVILVILSHLPTGLKLPGGFVGVDIFFVISGFVITRMLLVQESSGATRRHLYRQFMTSRLSRLVPPLAGMIAGTLLLGVLFAPTTMLHQISQSALFSNGFLSNFYFLRNFDSYWNPNILRNPFLHTWSLGIEFQIYLVLPLFLLGTIRGMQNNRRLGKSAMGIGALSFLSVAGFVYLLEISQTSIRGHVPSSAAFYLPITRFWEFGVGALTALLVVNQSPKWIHKTNFLQPLAWLAIGWGLVMSNRVGELNVYVIAVVIGTAVVIGVGEHAQNHSATRILTCAPMKWIGDRSYSIYLWHWPLLATASWLYPGDRLPALLLLALSFPIAMFSCKYLERHRSSKPVFSALRLWSPLALSAIVIAVSLHISTASWYQLPRPLVNIASAFPESSKTGADVTSAVSPICAFGEYEIHCKNFPDVTKEIVIIGDSLSYRSFPAVQLAAREHGVNASMFWNGGCSIEINSCRNSLIGNLIYDYLAKTDVVGLLIATNYDRESNRINAVERDLGLKPLCDALKSTKECSLHKKKIQVFETDARAGLAQLHTFSDHILVALPFPQQAQIPPTCLSQPLYARIFHVSLSGETCGKTSVDWQKERQGYYPDVITKVAKERDFVELWNPDDFLCYQGWCPAVINGGEQLMSDGIHWTMEGSRFLYPVIDQFIDKSLKG